MRALGLDLGRRRIGVAVSDSAGLMASPHETVSAAATTPATIAGSCDDRGRGRECSSSGSRCRLDGSVGPAATSWPRSRRWRRWSAAGGNLRRAPHHRHRPGASAGEGSRPPGVGRRQDRRRGHPAVVARRRRAMTPRPRAPEPREPPVPYNAPPDEPTGPDAPAVAGGSAGGDPADGGEPTSGGPDPHPDGGVRQPHDQPDRPGAVRSSASTRPRPRPPARAATPVPPIRSPSGKHRVGEPPPPSGTPTVGCGSTGTASSTTRLRATGWGRIILGPGDDEYVPVRASSGGRAAGRWSASA